MLPTVFVCAAAFLAAPPAAPAPAADPEASLRRAEKLFSADKFGEAEPLYKAATRSAMPFVKRQAYERLMGLYVRSGRQDKAIQLSVPFRAWLTEVGDKSGQGELELLVGECYLGLGYLEKADRHLTTALAAVPPLTDERRLEALRYRAETAVQRRDADAPKRWEELQAGANQVAARADHAEDLSLRVSTRRFLAEALNRRGEVDQALATLAALPEMIDRLNDPIVRRDVQRQRANLLASRGRYAEAVPLFQEALELQRKHRGEMRMAAGDILAEWATAAASIPEHKAEAAKLRGEAAVEYHAVLDAPVYDDPDGGSPIAAFAKLQILTRASRQIIKALALSQDAAQRWSGDELIDARLQSDRGGLELLQNAYQPARELLSKSLAQLEKAQPPDLRLLPIVLVNLATAELACDFRDRTEALLDQCVALYRDQKIPADPILAECEYLRGAAASQRGDFANAMKAFRNGLAVCGVVGKAADPVLFNLWLNTALIHKDQGDIKEAVSSLDKALAALASYADADDENFSLIHAVQADLHISKGEFADALKLVPGIELACQKKGIKAGYIWTTTRHIRALERLYRHDLKGAEAIWVDLATVQRKEGQLLLARTLNFLGVAAELQGREADAIKHFEDSKEFQATRPRCGPITKAITFWRLGALMDKAGKKAEAKQLITHVFDVADRARLNTFGEATQRAQFFAQFAPAFDLLAHWSVRDLDGDALLRVAARSRSRTLLDQILAAGVDPRNSLTGPDRDKLLAREAHAREAVSHTRARAQLISPVNADDPALKKALEDLDAAQQEYADAWREIINADPLTRVLTDPAFAEQALVKVRQEAANAQAVLLSYVIGRDESFAVLAAGPNAKPEIFRLVSPALADKVGDAPKGEATAQAGQRGIAIRPTHKQPDRPALAPGPTAPLTEVVVSRLVDQYLTQIADPEFNATRGIALISKYPNQPVLAAPGEMLGDAVLPPALRERIRASGAKRLIVVPDGALHKLPFEALLLSTGNSKPRYALDELPAIAYAPSTAVLSFIMNRPRHLEGPSTLLTVGDPTYGDPKSPAAPVAVAPVVRTGYYGILPPLPFTLEESRRIREYFPSAQVTALTGKEATERNVVAAIPGKRYIHLAAHGFADESFGNLYAAVALTPPPPGEAVMSDNDGFLSLYEIYRLKLTCELTVLSACTTNVGPQRPLEAGVTLAGAFLCAGSRGVMASCWSVDDKATAELMGEFFKTVRPSDPTPASYADSLKTARLKIRSQPGWESPFYWAPFVFVGPPN